MAVSMASGVKVRHWSRAEYFSHLHHLARAATAPASLVTLARWEGENVSGQVAFHSRSLLLFQTRKMTVRLYLKFRTDPLVDLVTFSFYQIVQEFKVIISLAS